VVEKEYLTIKEFADLVKVSPQSVYKRIRKANNPIKPYLKEVDGVQCISRSAAVLYKAAAATEETNNINDQIEADQQRSEPQPEKNSIDRLLDILDQQLKEQQKQLIEKDRQLIEKDKQIEKLLDQIAEITKIVDQQQQLTALNHKNLLIDQKEETDQPQPEPQQKESFWKRFFK
jgi:DNA-directed RNA polymerase specialized sigma subunit